MKKTIILILIVLIVSLALIYLLRNNVKNNHSATLNDKALVVSILPIKYIVQQIVGDEFSIDVLVPPGSSPETYEPTPQQLISVYNASLVFTTGLIDFEHELLSKATHNSDNKLVNLSRGIDLLDGCCGGASHSHHNHGTDPHIWTSPRQLLIMAKNVYESIVVIEPDNAETYRKNYLLLAEKLHELDKEIETTIITTGIKKFFIYHPALTYYADEYGIDQVAIEQDGKEPSAEQLKLLIDIARESKINKILYQSEFSRSVVETVAKDMAINAFVIDPLAEDIIGSIRHITTLITE